MSTYSFRNWLLGAAIFVQAASGLAQRSGVLLGVAGAATNEEADTQSFDTIHEPQYQTLWIAADGAGELKVLATLPELIVPRRDGFWHVGVKQVCEFADANESLRHGVWAAPVMRAGTVEQSQPCTPHKPEDYAPPIGRAEADQDKISQCGFELVNLQYVSPELIVMRTYSGQSEDCEARGGRYSMDFKVRNFDSEEGLSFGQVVGGRAHESYVRALPKQGHGDDGGDCGEPDSASDTGWRIAHKAGRWRPYVHQSLGYFGCAADAPVSVPLPASLTGDAAATADWKLLQSKIAGMVDAYVSPNGDMLVATSPSETRFFEVREGVPGKLLLTLPAQGIVMAQWATGTHVRDWTAEMEKLAKQHLPEPVARVKPAAK